MVGRTIYSAAALLLLMTSSSGCARLVGERCCPTDARQIYVDVGEEAVRQCPCGVDDCYYGYKPTCWRTWPGGWGCWCNGNAIGGNIEYVPATTPAVAPGTPSPHPVPLTSAEPESTELVEQIEQIQHVEKESNVVTCSQEVHTLPEDDFYRLLATSDEESDTE